MPMSASDLQVPMVAVVAGECLQDGFLDKWEQYIEEVEEEFAREEESVDEAKGTGFTFVQSDIHQGFENRVEEDLTSVLDTIGVDSDTFLKLCGQGASDEAAKGNSDLAAEREAFQVFSQIVLSATDFHIFADIMRNRQKRAYYFNVMRSWRRALK